MYPWRQSCNVSGALRASMAAHQPSCFFVSDSVSIVLTSYLHAARPITCCPKTHSSHRMNLCAPRLLATGCTCRPPLPICGVEQHAHIHCMPQNQKGGKQVEPGRPHRACTKGLHKGLTPQQQGVCRHVQARLTWSTWSRIWGRCCCSAPGP